MKQEYGYRITWRFSGIKGFCTLLCLPLLMPMALPCFAGSKGDLKRGKQIFQDTQCAICHLDGGNKLNPEHPLKGPLFLQRYPSNNNKELEKTIRQGITSKGMPAFARDKLSDKDLQDIIAYIRSLSPETGKRSK